MEQRTGHYVSTIAVRNKPPMADVSSAPGVGERNSSGSNMDIQWEDRIRTFRDLVNSGKYPCIVKVQRGEIDKYVPQDPGDEDPGVKEGKGGGGDGEAFVLQVLELRRHKMLVGERLLWDRKSDEYVTTGKSFEMPVTQKGWFEVLPDNGQPVEYFDTINAIVNIRPKQFLVRTSIVGYQLSMDNGVSCWVPWEIRPGEVLTTGIVHMDHKKTKKKRFLKRIFSSTKTGKKEQELKYLQCFDHENREIMVPVIMTGVFSPVGDSVSPNYDAVYSLYDLVMAFHLPIQAQLIHTDSQNVTGVPSGMLRFERMRDQECLLVAKHPYVEGESKTFKIPVSDSIILVKEKKKKSNRKPQTSVSDQTENEPGYAHVVSNPNQINDQVDLPVRVKDTKRSRGSALLEKLSVRSKAKKERASLKALQEVGVFSSRLSRNDISYDEFFKPDDGADTNEANDQEDTKDVNDPPQENEMSKTTEPPYDETNSKREIDLANDYSIPNKRTPMQDRDLPPIPQKTRSPKHSAGPNKESIYEELPVAPGPPRPEVYLAQDGHRREETYGERDGHVDDPDGYMTPARMREGLRDPVRQEFDDINSRSEYSVVVRRKPPTAPARDSLKFTRSRRARSEYTPVYNNEPEVNFDDMFDYGYNDQSENPYERQRSHAVYGASPYRGDGPLEEVVPTGRRRGYLYDDTRKFVDDSVIEQRPLSGYPKFRSRSQKNLHVDTNATIRSHNVRKMRTALEVFNFSDSLRDLRQPAQSVDGRLPPEPTYGRVMDNERVKSYVFGDGSGASGAYTRPGYAESEPGFRKYYRSGSIGALSESFPKHGDDSAISMCSRGDYSGLPGESEYSYSEYSEWHDDGWAPPDDIGSLSVVEVSKSLRYIGMKDRVVIRFAHEQIDGGMLCSLDKKLLKEGFPELNALEIKKILDFVGGWRPKK